MIVLKKPFLGPLTIEKVLVKFIGEEPRECRLESFEELKGGTAAIYTCEESRVKLHILSSGNSSLLGVEVDSLSPLDPYEPVKILLGRCGIKRFLGLTLHPHAGRRIYSPAFRYYPRVAIDRKPEGPKPPEVVDYPPAFAKLGHREFVKGYPCWTYHYFGESVDNLAQYTVFMLAELEEGRFISLATFSNGVATGYLEPGPALRIMTGRDARSIELSWIVALATSDDPYRTVEEMMRYASLHWIVRLRNEKPEPSFLRKFGWCSWNALLTLDLSHENIVKIVKGLLEKNVPIRWVIVDDGWQIEERRELPGLAARVMKRLGTDEEKFPKGFRAMVEELKRLGIEKVGLWHTINIHWGGAHRQVAEDLGAELFRVPWLGTYVPHYELEKALDFYTKLFSWVTEQVFDFV